MKNFSKLIVLIAMITAIGSATVMAAETGEKVSADDQHMDWHKMSPEKMRGHMAERQAALHDALKLSTTQEPAWKTYVTATTIDWTNKQHGNRADMEKLSAPERMEKNLTMTKDREARMASDLTALKTFYATLTPTQQKVFNEQTRHGGKRHHGEHAGEARAKG